MSQETHPRIAPVREILISVLCLQLGVGAGLLFHSKEMAPQKPASDSERRAGLTCARQVAQPPAHMHDFPIAAASFGVAEQEVVQNTPPDGGDALSVRRARFISFLRAEAKKQDLPAEIADAVVYVESGYDPLVIGGFGEIGLMQLRPQTAATLGFVGDSAELARPEINMRYGVEYLAGAWRLAGGDLCRALMKYRAGHGEERMTRRSLAYCNRATAYLRYSNAEAFVSTHREATPRKIIATHRNLVPARSQSSHVHMHDSAQFWAAHEARIRVIRQRVYAHWRALAQTRSAAARYRGDTNL